MQYHQWLAELGQVFLGVSIRQVLEELAGNDKAAAAEDDFHLAVGIDLADFVRIVQHGVGRIKGRANGGYRLE